MYNSRNKILWGAIISTTSCFVLQRSQVQLSARRRGILIYISDGVLLSLLRNLSNLLFTSHPIIRHPSATASAVK
jgi:hypothetical protein